MVEGFGERTLKNIVRVGQSAQAWKEIVNDHVLLPLWKKTTCFPHGSLLPIAAFASWPAAFWEEALLGIFHAMGHDMLSKRSMDELVRALHSEKPALLNIHKRFMVFVDSQRMVIFNSKLLPKSPKEMGCWRLTVGQAMPGPSLAGLLNGTLTVRLATWPYGGASDLPDELTGRLPGAKTIMDSAKMAGASPGESFVVQLSASTDALVLQPAIDISQLLSKLHSRRI